MAGIELFDANGVQVVGGDTSLALILGSVTVGGSNQAQSGSFTDARLALGRPFSLVTHLEVNTFIGYRPIVTFNGTTINWSWPPQYGSAAFPRARFIYGLK